MTDQGDLRERISRFYDDYHRGRLRTPSDWMKTHYWTAFVGRVLEVGGGTLHPDRADYAVIDLSAEAIKRCHLKAIPGAMADGAHMPFKDRAFDTAACFDVLEHVVEPERFISELCRISAQRVVIAGPNYIGRHIGGINRYLPLRLLDFWFGKGCAATRLENPHLSFDEQWQPDFDAVTAPNAGWVAGQMRRHGFNILHLRSWELGQAPWFNHFPALRCLGQFMFVVGERRA